MKTYTCDKCGTEFKQPLDTEVITDEHKITHILDLCAICRNGLMEEKKTVVKNFLKNIKKNK